MEKLKKQLYLYIPYNEQEKEDKEIMLDVLEKIGNVFTRDCKIAHFTASSWIVNKDKTKVLMIYHNIYDSWSWTGGHADGDTDLLQVALKEAREETGLKNLKLLHDGIFSLEIGCVDSHIRKGKFISNHLHLNSTYLFEADENETLHIKEDENSGVAWFDLDKAVEVSAEQDMKQVYIKLNEKLRKMYNN